VYVGFVKRKLIRFSIIALMIYGGLVWATMKGFQIVPEGFVPCAGQSLLAIGFAQLPDAARPWIAPTP
jgi:hypothetical protein